MIKMKCVAVDDEPLALVKMRNYIDRVNYLELMATFDNAIEALHFLRKYPVDLLFLDVQMEDLSGIQLLEVMQRRPMVILTTAFDQYALKGYELDVLDYLLKPIDFQRFLKSTERAYHQFQMRQPEPPRAEPSENAAGEFVLVRSEYKMIRINLEEILYIEGMKDYSRFHCRDRRIMTMQTIGKLEEALPHPRFFRIHKSFIIAVDKMEAFGKNQVQMIDGKELPIGNLYKQAFLDYLEGFQQV